MPTKREKPVLFNMPPQRRITLTQARLQKTAGTVVTITSASSIGEVRIIGVSTYEPVCRCDNQDSAWECWELSKFTVEALSVLVSSIGKPPTWSHATKSLCTRHALEGSGWAVLPRLYVRFDAQHRAEEFQNTSCSKYLLSRLYHAS